MENGALAMFAHYGWLPFGLGDDFPSLDPHFGTFGSAFAAELEPHCVPLILSDHVWRNEDTWIIAQQISTTSELL
jgi:hypothetical protein